MHYWRKPTIEEAKAVSREQKKQMVPFLILAFASLVWLILVVLWVALVSFVGPILGILLGDDQLLRSEISYKDLTLLLIPISFLPVWTIILIFQFRMLALIKRRDFQVEVGVCLRKFMETNAAIIMSIGNFAGTEKKPIPMLQVIYDQERSVNVVVKPSVYGKTKAGSTVITIDPASQGFFSTLGVSIVVCDRKREG